MDAYGKGIWKIIEIGTYPDVNTLYATLTEEGFYVGDWARDVLFDPAFALAPEKHTAALVRTTTQELGFKAGAYREDIYKRAKEQGLDICHPEVGPQLRLQYTDQKRLESLQIGMKPMKDSEKHESEFRVVHAVDGNLWLVGDHKHPDDFWYPDDIFIFQK